MTWIRKDSTPEEIADEVKMNLEADTPDKINPNARFLILGTNTPKGYTMRLTMKNPETVAGILYNHAIKTGELDDAMTMARHMVQIGLTAQKLILQEVSKRKQQN